MYVPCIILILQNLITNIFHFFINNLGANFKTLNCNCNVRNCNVQSLKVTE